MQGYILSPMYDIILLHTFRHLLMLTILWSIVYKRLSKSHTKVSKSMQ